MAGKINKLIILALISFIPTLLIWLPFFLRTEKIWGIPLPREGMATVVSNYDGPQYLVVAKTMYDKAAIGGFAFTVPSEYYAAHFPLFPILVRFFGEILGFPYSLLFVTAFSSFLAIYFFHKLISEYVSWEDSIFTTFVFSILPARFLIVRSIGSPEPLFLAGIIASIYYFKKQKYLAASIWGAISVMTKSPGILLFISYVLAIVVPWVRKAATTSNFKFLWKSNIFKYIPLLLMPAALLLVFYFYQIKMNDFWAYFHSGDNIHLFFPPFQIFNYSQSWVGTFWLEEIIFVYLIGALGLSNLIKAGEKTISWFVGIFFILILFVSHRDLLRYALPIVPFLFIAFKDLIAKKEFKLVIILLIIPIYLFSLAYISQNRMPIADWAPLL